MHQPEDKGFISREKEKYNGVRNRSRKQEQVQEQHTVSAMFFFL